ncbi:MAG: hypothetical protein WDN69_30490 [Aliidongia sp.]
MDEPEEDRDISITEPTWPLGAGESAIDEELKEDMLFTTDEEGETDVEGELEGDAEADDLADDKLEIPDELADDDL